MQKWLRISHYLPNTMEPSKKSLIYSHNQIQFTVIESFPIPRENVSESSFCTIRRCPDCKILANVAISGEVGNPEQQCVSFLAESH